MSRERAEQHLDTMLVALRNPPASLDEVAQARIQARLEAAIEHAADVAALRALGGRRRGVVVAGAAIAAAIAVAALFVVVIAPRSGKPGDGERVTAGQPARSGSAAAPATDGAAGGAAAPVAAADRSAGGASAGGGAAGAGSLARGPAAGDAVAGAAVGREATVERSADGTAASAAAADMATTLIRVAAGESAEVTIGGAVVIVYGPGWLSPKPDGAVVDAAGITVNRSRGDTPWAMHYHDVKIVVTHAAFSASRTTETRVSVMRGEIELQCPSSARTLPSGASATCETMSRIGVAAPRRAAAPALEPAPRRAAAPAPEPPPPPPPLPLPLEAPPPSPEAGPAPVAADPYAVAEVAMSRGDLDAAGAALLAITAAAPDSLDAATALLDLARLAVRRGDTALALGYLDRLDHHPRSAALAAATAHLRATLTRPGAVRPPSAR